MLKLVPIILFFISISTSNTFGSNGDWELKKEANGIKVYVRKVDKSNFDEFKATTTIQACTMDKVLEVLLDVNNYAAWFPDCANPRILKQINKYHDIHYIESTAPWPAQDRYGIYEQVTTFSDSGLKAKIIFQALPDYPVETIDMVRITEGLGIWTLEEKEKSVFITYQFLGNPGGKVPAWITNAFVVKHPFETLTNLTARLN